KRASRVRMISYSSGRARSSFVPPQTVLFVNKKNQKNFRRMLTHPQAVLAQITAAVSVALPRPLSAGARD
ncbi:hypothetical protein, partial [uncultured Rikenella sp.]